MGSASIGADTGASIGAATGAEAVPVRCRYWRRTGTEPVPLLAPGFHPLLMNPHLHTAPDAVEPASKKELAAAYGVHRNTMRAWCRQAGLTATRSRLTAAQVQQLHLHFGLPGTYTLLV